MCRKCGTDDFRAVLKQTVTTDYFFSPQKSLAQFTKGIKEGYKVYEAPDGTRGCTVRYGNSFGGWHGSDIEWLQIHLQEVPKDIEFTRNVLIEIRRAREEMEKSMRPWARARELSPSQYWSQKNIRLCTSKE
ncbi:MAG: hypothetical protein K2W82_01040 [Candidatus Obscuribacterales bacterium]|nr:hypothetical protein [Candidatus Obscuribacterales bacterium]